MSNATILTPRHKETITEYEHIFCIEGEDPRDGCYGFACDKDGSILPTLAPIAVENYKKCCAGEMFTSDGLKFIDMGIQKNTRVITVDAMAKCGNCGEEFPLYNNYHGACECPGCEQWYNLFGQALRSPHEWGEETGEMF